MPLLPDMCRPCDCYWNTGAIPTCRKRASHQKDMPFLLRGYQWTLQSTKLLLEHGAIPNVNVESSGDTLSKVMTNHDEKMFILTLHL
ncbi:MAG: hypothetical protein M2R45_05187 [Verrucomicrobia subdivision 3 bacterium]|nr:hypothetical protein [Limisphaerales bacterium]MCS1417588.1 hypothetical protein [Limisphaerales bacterium]